MIGPVAEPPDFRQPVHDLMIHQAIGPKIRTEPADSLQHRGSKGLSVAAAMRLRRHQRRHETRLHFPEPVLDLVFVDAEGEDRRDIVASLKEPVGLVEIISRIERVGVAGCDKRRLNGRNAGLQGARLARAAFLKNDRVDAGLVNEPTGEFSRSVRRRVVDEDEARFSRLRKKGTKRRFQKAFLVVERKHDGPVDDRRARRRAIGHEQGSGAATGPDSADPAPRRLALRLRPNYEARLMIVAPLHRIVAGIGRLRRPGFDARAAVELAKFGLPFFPPSRFALAASTLLALVNDVMINRRRLALELGAGASTLYLAKALKAQGGRLISVESDKTWLDHVVAATEAAGLSDVVTPVLAPLTPHASGSDWYDLGALKAATAPKSIDLLLVDGPPSGKGKPSRARAPAIPELADRLADRCAVFFDDIHRPAHARIAEEWSTRLGVRFAPHFARGGFAYARRGDGFDPVM